MREVIAEYKEEMFGCSHHQKSASFLTPCDSIPAHEIEVRFQQDPHISFVVKAVSALTAAFRLVQLDHCTTNVQASCLRKVHADLHEDILDNLRKLSFSSMMPHGTSVKEVEGTQHHFTRNGRLVANKQMVYVIDRKEGLHLIGEYSEDEGLDLDNSLDLLTTEDPISSPLVNHEADRTTFARSINEPYVAPADEDNYRMSLPSDLETLPIFSYESFISRTWALVVVSAAIFGFFVSLWMLIYVFQKICDGTLNGNQVMGVLLLVGVMCLFVSVIPWLLPPNETVCAVRHFMHPLLMVMCFSILLVKSMQLRSLVTIGLGGSIPQINQVVSLFFMVMVQVVIAVEWYMATKPIGIQITEGYPECGVSRSRFLLLHIYPTVLLLLSFFYGVSVLKVKRNFNEGRWITCATIFIIPIFAAWPVVYYFAPVPFHDPSVSVSVLSVAGILLFAIFFPKMHTIAQQNTQKIANTADLSRTHSDATVYTGFSDYVPFLGPGASKAKPTLYPVYGYTTNHFVPPIKPHHRSRHHSQPGSPSKKKHRSSPKKDDFNGMNYVTPPTGAQLKSYSDWSREYAPSVSVAHGHYEQYPPPRPHGGGSSHHYQDHEPLSSTQIVYSVNRGGQPSHGAYGGGHHHNSRSMSRDVTADTATLLTTSSKSSQKRSKRSKSREDQASRSRRSRSHGSPSRFVDYSEAYRQRLERQRQHSQSPSDGMILTASGLTSSEAEQSQGGQSGYRVSEVFLTH